MGQGHPFRPQRAQRRAEEPGPQQEQRGGFAQLLQLLPIIVLVLMSFGGSGNSAQPSFSLHSTPPYVLPRRTPAPLMVNYYVSESFDRYYPLGTDAHRRLMREVEGEYRSRLAHQCNTEQAVRSRKINQVRRAWGCDGVVCAPLLCFFSFLFFLSFSSYIFSLIPRNAQP